MHDHRTLFDHRCRRQSDCIFKTSSTTSVDCTLSLGTPSTRLSNTSNIDHQRYRKQPSANTLFSWDHVFNSQPPPQHHTSTYYSPYKPLATRTSTSNAASDSLLARRCANCDTTSTPLWRNGPRGPKSLCNACGIRFKKEARRATAATAPSNNAAYVEMQHYNINPWLVQSQKPASLSPVINNEFRFIEDEKVNNGIPILSWRLNVTDRPSLVHDFTR